MPPKSPWQTNNVNTRSGTKTRSVLSTRTRSGVSLAEVINAQILTYLRWGYQGSLHRPRVRYYRSSCDPAQQHLCRDAHANGGEQRYRPDRRDETRGRRYSLGPAVHRDDNPQIDS